LRVVEKREGYVGTAAVFIDMANCLTVRRVLLGCCRFV